MICATVIPREETFSGHQGQLPTCVHGPRQSQTRSSTIEVVQKARDETFSHRQDKASCGVIHPLLISTCLHAGGGDQRRQVWSPQPIEELVAGRKVGGCTTSADRHLPRSGLHCSRLLGSLPALYDGFYCSATASCQKIYLLWTISEMKGKILEDRTNGVV